MASTPQHGLAQILPTDDETPYSTPKFRPNSHRNSSFSSSSRSNSFNSSSESSPFFFNNSSPPHSPTTPLNLKGIPFSWEQTPGIPKNRHGFKKTETSNGHRLPLPPAGSATSSAAAKKQATRFKRDPFFAAMLECSKDGHDHDHDHGTNFWKGNNLSDRLGLINMYTSCKKTCAISESIVYVPRGGPHYLRRGPVKP